MVFDGFEDGGMAMYGGPSIHNSWAMHVHLLERHAHCINHSKIVMSWGWLCWLLGFTRA